MNRIKQKFFLFLLFILAFCFRIYGINWDHGQHLHPDERFLTMVETTIKLPGSIKQYFDTSNSPLNPSNYPEYRFFVYGTFPVFLTKLVGQLFKLNNYDQIFLVGRVLSAFFDSINIFTLYFLTRLFLKTKKSLYLLLPSFFYMLGVLPLQLSHFFTVDTFLNTFLLLTFTFLAYFLKNHKLYFLFLASISWGLALSSKISAIYFIPIISFFFLFYFLNKKHFLNTFYKGLLFLFISFVTFRIFQPYAFVDLIKINPIFVDNINTLKQLGDPDTIFPPSIQWLSKTPVLFPLQNIVLFGLGLPFSVFFLFFTFKSIFKTKLRLNPVFFCLIFWVIFLVIYQGSQFAHPMRYFLPIYPLVFVLVSVLVWWLKISRSIIIVILILHFGWGLSFLNIYSHSHTRIEASYWIYQNVVKDSNIISEYWDDPLPLFLPGSGLLSYNNQQLPFYDPDTSQKWQELTPQIQNSDYIILSSNRLWASIPKVPSRYPDASKYYQDLFDEKLGYKLIKKIVSYPGFSLPIKTCIFLGPTAYPYKSKLNQWFEVDHSCSYPGIYFRDDMADESFTVYDHPQVLIFQKI